MRTHTTNKPLGSDAATNFSQRQQARTNDELQFFDSETVKVQHTTRGIRLHAKSPPAQPSSSELWPPKNYPVDETGLAGKTFATGQWIYVLPGCALVAVGVTDPDSGETVTATPGTWRALRPVAPVSDGAGGFKYHIPQLPYPTPDDPTALNNYWWLISENPQCY